MLQNRQPPSPALKQSRERAIQLLVQLTALFFLFLAIASFMLIILSNFGLIYIDTHIYPIIPKSYRDRIDQKNWNDYQSSNKNHGVLYCPLKYETLSEEVADAWHSPRNYYECPVPTGQSIDGDNDYGSIWNLAGQSGISRVVCCEKNRCCTTHQWMDFTIFYSIMSRYAPWPVILFIVMLFTTFITIVILFCAWQIFGLGRSIFCKNKSQNGSTRLPSVSPTLSQMDSLFLSQCPNECPKADTVGAMQTAENNNRMANNYMNNNENGASAPSSNGSSAGSQSTGTTGFLADMHSRASSSLSMTAFPPHMSRLGHVSLMTPPTLPVPMGTLPPIEDIDLAMESQQNLYNRAPNQMILNQNPWQYQRNSMTLQNPGLQNCGSHVPSASTFLPSPTEVPKVDLVTTFQWQNNASTHYESVNAQNMNPATNVII